MPLIINSSLVLSSTKQAIRQIFKWDLNTSDEIEDGISRIARARLL
ncbi:hypothetical protein [Pseudomonas sp. Irchel s3f19]|nr:hypothetical protein [Pseudomonas sp. Irchel s3f19]